MKKAHAINVSLGNLFTIPPNANTFIPVLSVALECSFRQGVSERTLHERSSKST
jgi:hypothetical protein